MSRVLFYFIFSSRVYLSQVIPSLLRSGADVTEKPCDLYAFISVDDTSKPNDHKKALCGQIKIYNLAKSKFVGGLLAEVKSSCFVYSIYL